MSSKSYSVPPHQFRLWLNNAQKSLYSKNRSRKDMWQEFCDMLVFDSTDNSLLSISPAFFISLQTFCNQDGKGGDLSSDQALAFATLLNSLRSRLKEHTDWTATLPQTEQEQHEE
jgi:hypothetical protein